jgi:hypothetical protein
MTMKKLTTQPAFDLKAHLSLLKNLLIIANAIVLGLVLVMHLIFYDFPIEVSEEFNMVLPLLGWASLVAVVVSFVELITDAAIRFYHNRHLKQAGEMETLMPIKYLPAS